MEDDPDFVGGGGFTSSLVCSLMWQLPKQKLKIETTSFLVTPKILFSLLKVVCITKSIWELIWKTI
jgi:hypothetical protein